MWSFLFVLVDMVDVLVLDVSWRFCSNGFEYQKGMKLGIGLLLGTSA